MPVHYLTIVGCSAASTASIASGSFIVYQKLVNYYTKKFTAQLNFVDEFANSNQSLFIYNQKTSVLAQRIHDSNNTEKELMSNSATKNNHILQFLGDYLICGYLDKEKNKEIFVKCRINDLTPNSKVVMNDKTSLNNINDVSNWLKPWTFDLQNNNYYSFKLYPNTSAPNNFDVKLKKNEKINLYISKERHLDTSSKWSNFRKNEIPDVPELNAENTKSKLKKIADLVFYKNLGTSFLPNI